MKKEAIHLADFHRILFGDAPTIFVAEVFIRAVITYLILLVVIRWLGKRMRGQVTILEMAVMLTLGAIISTAMQVPESGILMAVLVLICTLTFERGLSWLEFKSIKVERISQGQLSILVRDGVIQTQQMVNERISNNLLFSDLRSQGIHNLGQVKRLYLEASGMFTLFEEKEERPGLCTFPAEDPQIAARYKPLPFLTCVNCGYINPAPDRGICAHCQHGEWVYAITTKDRI